MTLSFGDEERSASVMPGVYIDRVLISSVKDISGQKMPFNNEKCDIGIELTLDIGRSYKPVVTIAGKFERDETGVITGWGKAFPVNRFLSSVEIKGSLTHENRLPAEVLQNLVGRYVWRLSYVKGRRADNPEKLSYSTWNTMLPGDVPENEGKLLELFKKSLKRGYPSNYKPEVLEPIFLPPDADKPVSKPDEKAEDDPSQW